MKISSDFSGKIGYTSEELIGHNLSILMPSFLKDEHQKKLCIFGTKGVGKKSFEKLINDLKI